MTEVQIRVVGAQAVEARKDGRLTTGMVGAVARFSFDRVWDGLTKVAVFKGSGVTKDVLEWDGNAVRIPPEVLREAGRLYVGVEGRNGDGSVVIPTVWVDCGMVLCGAESSGDPSVDPGLAVWQQIQNQMGDLAQLQTKDKASLVAAINEAAKTGGAGATNMQALSLIRDLLYKAVYTENVTSMLAQLDQLLENGGDAGGDTGGSGGSGEDSGGGSEDTGGSGGGSSEATGDEDVVVTGASATDDGNGNVTVTGLTATDDGNGNITVS